jgi:hypothetical protein
MGRIPNGRTICPLFGAMTRACCCIYTIFGLEASHTNLHSIRASPSIKLAQARGSLTSSEGDDWLFTSSSSALGSSVVVGRAPADKFEATRVLSTRTTAASAAPIVFLPTDRSLSPKPISRPLPPPERSCLLLTYFHPWR